MSLFEVPGWSVPAAPVQASSSKKRKRPEPDAGAKVQSAAVNVEKLMAKLEAGDGEHARKKAKKAKGKAVERDAPQKGAPQPKKDGGKGPKQGKPAQKKHVKDGEGDEEGKEGRVQAASPNDAPKKKNKNKGKGKGAEKAQQQEPEAMSPAPKPAPGKKNASPEKGLTKLQAGMKHSLDGARFRWINETLYKSDSDHAHQMMRENPSIFSEYHTGFRHQVQSWPVNPVSHYISELSKYPAKTVIADLGCGDAALAQALVPKGLTVLSFDLVSDGAYVVEADICSKLPLPGAEVTAEDGAHGAQVVDVVVFALSLMSVNWVGAIREAWRVLKAGGELKIAEVASRFSEVEAFVSLVSSVGFKLRSKDDSNTHFTLFEFSKVNRKPKSDKEWEKLMARGEILKPCEYKRR